MHFNQINSNVKTSEANKVNIIFVTPQLSNIFSHQLCYFFLNISV